MKKQILNAIRKLKRIVSGNQLTVDLDIKIEKNWCGNEYGGFFINPSINSNSIIYSMGIGEDLSFDLELIQTYKCEVFGFDPTPKSIEWVKKQSLPKKFIFFDYGINDETGKEYFYLPKNKLHVSGSVLNNSNVDEINKIEVDMKKFIDIVKELGHKRIDVLKMDIEGSEYKVLPDVLKSKIEIQQILVEVHHRFTKNGKEKTYELIELLKNNDYKLFGISDSQEELSFIKNL
jgi:FkbM family methyltransferase